MADTHQTSAAVRDDRDILDDIQRIILTYPPASDDRHQFTTDVTGGVVTLSGNVRTPITRGWLRDHIAGLPGVARVDVGQLYSDEELRIEAGQVLVEGALVNVEHGAVILSGRLPADAELDALIARLGNIAGVRRVLVLTR